MADVIDRAAVLTEVERFHGHFMYLNEELNLIRELLAVEGASRQRIPGLCSGVKDDLRKKTEDLDSFRAGAAPAHRSSKEMRWSSPRPVPH